jgi:hypothetical protein
VSADANHLTYQAMFWLERARAGSAQAGRPEYWFAQCREIAARLIGAGCERMTAPTQGDAA